MVKNTGSVIRELVDGALLNGGATVPLNRGVSLRGVYVVGNNATGHTARADAPRRTIAAAAALVVDRALSVGANGVGSWRNDVDNRIYFDIVDIFTDRAEAVSCAIDRGELALGYLAQSGVFEEIALVK